jgi:hypothetical protein
LTTIDFLLQRVIVLFTGVALRVGRADEAVAGAIVETETTPGALVEAGENVGGMFAVEVVGAAVVIKTVELVDAGATDKLTATVGVLEVELETPGNTVKLTGIVVFVAPGLSIVVVLVIALILPTGMATGGDVAFGAPGGGIVVAFIVIALVVAFVTLVLVVAFVTLTLGTGTGATVGNATGGNV